MENTLLYIVFALFGAMLILNVYFRLKVMRSYRKMVQAGVEARARDLMVKETLETKIIPTYPEHEDVIREFVAHLRNGFRMTSVLLGLVVLFGYILMKFRT